ncbi:Mitotic checkpoint protein BUB3-like protein [Emericellopsis cladophorae]|uniref:Mitotic checkpoint protein BUB3-like protein n=1 Tax=Emericellopsis cladophorae TaxID=2686198 RepID=A0A9Q0BH66_9HYPO|nr:Mitotic checkpoint protein BUB3-like protein [Emericellopsis cladophorae]KAI6785212.1 Mitotic checkpoint protein BUB3-like protein [Emericellopsis cladophorae]
MAPATQYELSPPPGDAISALAFAPNGSTKLLAASWDKQLYAYDVAKPDSSLIKTYEHRAPVLDVCFGDNENEAYTAGMDCVVNKVNLETAEMTEMSKHAAPARCVVYSPAHGVLISASWDCSLNLHNVREPSSTPIRIALPGKPHAVAASPSKVVVAMTGRIINIYDLQTIQNLFSSGQSELKPWQQRESSLRYLTRAVACMPSDAGYATSSIEGRVAVEWFEDTAESQARKYAFKCHRQPAPDGDGDIVYPVNALEFHPVHGTFASGGGDSTVALWDAEAKRRLKQYQKFPDSIAAMVFSKDGKYLAIGVCPGFETGQEDYSGEGKTSILIRELGDNEAKGKGAK